MTTSPEELKKNFTDQIENTDKQIKELEENLKKATEYKLKLEGGLETLDFLLEKVINHQEKQHLQNLQ